MCEHFVHKKFIVLVHVNFPSSVKKEFFEKVVKEKMVVVASPDFLKKRKSKENPKENLRGEDYIHFQRTDINSLQEDMNLKLNPKFIFSDISTLRSALVHHHGWSLIPYYVVREDLQKKSLVDLNIKLNSPMSFGVWWKKDLEEKELILALVQFLKQIELV